MKQKYDTSAFLGIFGPDPLSPLALLSLALLQDRSRHVPEVFFDRHLIPDRELQPQVPGAERIEAGEEPGAESAQNDGGSHGEPDGALERLEDVPHGIGGAGPRQQDRDGLLEQRISEIDDRRA